MDFRQFGSTPVSKPEKSESGTEVPVSSQQSPRRPSFKSNMPKWINILYVVILFGIAALLILVVVSIIRSDGNSKEYSMVDNTKYQAVFLNNGQVYFGSITDLSGDYMRLNNVFYLTQTATGANTTDANSDYTLIKLGCQQIHYPYDQMVINRTQVTFWENLNADGKVTTSIEEFKKQNPNGPDCTQVTDQTQASTGTSTQGATTPATKQ